MRRLIDAEALKDHIKEVIKKQDGKNIDLVPVGELLTFIDREPTAYAPDKVVEQLEEVEKIMTSPVNQDCFGEECRASDCTVCLISKSIEIVKAGGLNEKTERKRKDMKYSIETTDKGCVETLEIGEEKFQRESIKIKGGCRALGEDFANQLLKAGYCEEIVDKVDEIYNGFGNLDFIQLSELI